MNCLRDAQAKAAPLLQEAHALLDGGNITPAGYARLDEIRAELKWISERAAEYRKEAKLRRELDRIGLNMEGTDNDMEDRFYDLSGDSPQGKDEGPLSKRFLNSPEYQAWYKGVAPSGVISDASKGLHSPPVEYKRGFKTLLTGASGTSAGAMVFPETAPFVGPAGRRELTLRDLITVIPTQSDQVQFAKQNTETNAAATVVEATATSGTSGTKPESEMTFTTVTVNIRTLAHFVPATKRAMSDAPMLRQLIDDFLVFGLQEELEDQMISGDGTGENFQGVVGTSGVQTQAFTENNIVTALRGRTKVKTVGRARPTAYLLHPTDVENIRLWRDNEGRFMLNDPGAPYSNMSLWGLPIIENEGLSPGVGFVGDFRELILFDREAIQVQVTDSHSDWFTRNMLAILGELRAGFCVRRPASLVKLALSAGGS
jgi:HK97 family phage major capsid protein